MATNVQAEGPANWRKTKKVAEASSSVPWPQDCPRYYLDMTVEMDSHGQTLSFV
jgi:hypothetical protein